MKEIKLNSGAVLSIGVTPFKTSKALYQAILEEAKELKIPSFIDMGQVIKDIFCMGFSSRKVEVALQECLSRCLYNGLKIDEMTWEPISSREDYTKVCLEVIEENLRPFLKGLSAELKRLSEMIPSSRT